MILRALHSAHPPPRPQIFRVFVTSLRAERVLGLPGLICTIGAARERGHENADIPVHVYGPPGTAEFLASIYQVGGLYRTPHILRVLCVPCVQRVRMPLSRTQVLCEPRHLRRHVACQQPCVRMQFAVSLAAVGTAAVASKCFASGCRSAATRPHVGSCAQVPLPVTFVASLVPVLPSFGRAALLAVASLSPQPPSRRPCTHTLLLPHPSNMPLRAMPASPGHAAPRLITAAGLQHIRGDAHRSARVHACLRRGRRAAAFQPPRQDLAPGAAARPAQPRRLHRRRPVGVHAHPGGAAGGGARTVVWLAGADVECALLRALCAKDQRAFHTHIPHGAFATPALPSPVSSPPLPDPNRPTPNLPPGPRDPRQGFPRGGRAADHHNG